jgi:hypothetical protein
MKPGEYHRVAFVSPVVRPYFELETAIEEYSMDRVGSAFTITGLKSTMDLAIKYDNLDSIGKPLRQRKPRNAVCPRSASRCRSDARPIH